ncbi:helix-turn-helix domain-containing protein [Bacillus sp. Au-Bac7]|uniref:helix-turn-helix domain-containing protein n=1 Tax=Bacillus sp. Au-Bac7 TaxID=2906458 RepID=UPI001E4CD34D|nr:helix-turn-helix domain-containing protein [Bacillus sp. Au-Bac7]MCE4047367.1 helix-turn-helix domain-containing protein [Bacillus sp. Au-Bac7]
MNRFYKRYSDLIFQLLSEDKWNSLAVLSDKTGFSKTTIWRDLEFLESILPQDWVFEKNETFGVRLIKPENGTLENLLGQIREKNTYLHTLKIILLNDGVDVSQICQEVHISRSTAYRHLEKLQEVVEQAEVMLTASPFRLVGDEKKIRRFIMQYLDFMSFETNIVKEGLDAVKFQEHLVRLFSNFSMSYRTGALHRLTIILFIANHRASMGHYISYPDKVLNTHAGSKYFELTKLLSPYMVKCPRREVQLQEILYFSIFIMSEERPLNRTKHLKYIHSSMKTERGYPMAQYLAKLDRFIGFPISQDDIFLFHLYQSLKRISVETEFETETVKNSALQYLDFFEENELFQAIEKLAEECLTPYSLLFKKLDTLEIFSLVQAAVIRRWNHHKIQVAVVCRTYSEKDYIREILAYHFDSKLKISSLDPSSLNLLYMYEEFDLLISAGELNPVNTCIEHIPKINISSFPTSSELREISYFIEQHFFENLGITKEMIYPFNETLM